MAKRVSPDAALLMLHWQNSVCDVFGAKISVARSRRTIRSAMRRACWLPRATAAY